MNTDSSTSGKVSWHFKPHTLKKSYVSKLDFPFQSTERDRHLQNIIYMACAGH